MVLGLDNESLRDDADAVQYCYRTVTTTINPIVDWSEQDVWEFLHHYGCDGNPLYQCGEKRVGCIGCPMAGKKKQRREFILYPKYHANYVRAFDRMLEVLKSKPPGEKQRTWQTGEDVMHWWISDNPDQLTLFDENELYTVLKDIEDGVTE